MNVFEAWAWSASMHCFECWTWS